MIYIPQQIIEICKYCTLYDLRNLWHSYYKIVNKKNTDIVLVVSRVEWVLLDN
jgi:hypothetical protein